MESKNGWTQPLQTHRSLSINCSCCSWYSCLALSNCLTSSSRSRDNNSLSCIICKGSLAAYLLPSCTQSLNTFTLTNQVTSATPRHIHVHNFRVDTHRQYTYTHTRHIHSHTHPNTQINTHPNTQINTHPNTHKHTHT